MTAKVIEFPTRPEHLSPFAKRNKVLQGAADPETPIIKVDLMLAILRADDQTVNALWRTITTRRQTGFSAKPDIAGGRSRCLSKIERLTEFIYSCLNDPDGETELDQLLVIIESRDKPITS